MQHLLSLTEANPLVMTFYQPLGQVSGQRELHCKLYHADTPLALSDVLPILENLGLRVLGEFRIACATPMAASSGSMTLRSSPPKA